MKTPTIALTALCVMLTLAAASPVLAAAEDPALTGIQPTASVAGADPAAPDPVGSLMGFLGLRHDIHARQAEDRNLSQDLRENQQEIHRNWWENIGLFENILGNRDAARPARQEELAIRQENLGLHEEIRDIRLDMQNNPGNMTAGCEQIADDRETIKENWQEINATHSTIQTGRNLSRENWSVIRTNNQEDITLRQENNMTREQIHTNRIQNQEDRRQIRDGWKNGSAAGAG